jgi:hypothetical protein
MKVKLASPQKTQPKLGPILRCRVPDDIKEKITAAARSQCATESQILRNAVVAYLNARGA